MNFVIIENPDPALKAKWGTLAHIPDSQRAQVLSSSFGKISEAIKLIESEIKQRKKIDKMRPIIRKF